MFAQHLDNAAAAGEFAAVEVFRQKFLHPHLFTDLVDGLQPVGGGFIRSEHAHGIGVQGNCIAQQLSQGSGVFGLVLARLLNGHGIGMDRRQIQAPAQQPTVGMGVGAHAALATWREGAQLGDKAALPIKEFARAVAMQPGLELP